MAYKAPIWEDGKSPAISAGNLNALSQAAEGAQVLYGNSAPTSSTEGAVGQFYLVVVADSDGNYALYQCVGISGSTYNWKLLGTTPAYAKVSNPVAETLGIPSGSSIEFALISNFAPIKIASYETAGSYEWTAPDLADGKAYKIGVLIIGGGASGGATRNTTSSGPRFAAGGPSGFSTSVVLTVSPGGVFALVVGAGGARATWAAYSVSGNAGGSSSFNGVVADGGESPYDGNGDDAYSRAGGSPSRCGNDAEDNGGFWGGAILLHSLSATSELDGRPDQCINPFTGEIILGSGGGAYSTTSGTDSALAGAGGKNPLNGLGGGNGVAAINGATITAEDASLPGCGGGAANVAGSNGVATSGAGADGAVYIYFLGVADE